MNFSFDNNHFICNMHSSNQVGGLHACGTSCCTIIVSIVKSPSSVLNTDSRCEPSVTKATKPILHDQDCSVYSVFYL